MDFLLNSCQSAILPGIALEKRRRALPVAVIPCGAWHRSFSCLFFYPSLAPFQGGNFTIPTDFTQGPAQPLRMA